MATAGYYQGLCIHTITEYGSTPYVGMVTKMSAPLIVCKMTCYSTVGA